VTDTQLYDLLFTRKACGARVEAYAELARDVTMQHYLGFWRDGRAAVAEKLVPAGTTVRVLMVSRLYDLGVTDRLDDATGYGFRGTPGQGWFTNCRLTREP
jgi:hypothetical protein